MYIIIGALNSMSLFYVDLNDVPTNLLLFDWSI